MNEEFPYLISGHRYSSRLASFRRESKHSRDQIIYVALRHRPEFSLEEALIYPRLFNAELDAHLLFQLIQAGQEITDLSRVVLTGDTQMCSQAAEALPMGWVKEGKRRTEHKGIGPAVRYT